MDDKELITFDEAIKRLPDEDWIHTFRNYGNVLMGADWKKEEIFEAMQAATEIEITGPQAQAIGHGLAICDEHGWLFIETANAGVERHAPQTDCGSETDSNRVSARTTC